MDTKSIPAGDPFHAAPHDTVEAHYASLERLEAPHACYDGVVFIGRQVEEDGEEVEVMEAVPCRRCTDSR